jgi:DtxR family Mn-dependent transcriptional regulator
MKTPSSHPTPTVEDYLGVIYTLSRDGETVIGRKLADWLEVSPPTVTVTIQRMMEHNLVTKGADKSIHLTELGEKAAISVIRRHMLAELLLARILGVSWSKVHEEADRLEHDLSSETAERLVELLQNSNMCPHGNPLPGHEDATKGFIPLLDAEPEREYLMARVHEEIERNVQLMSYLEEHCLIPGARVKLIAVMPFNETVTLQSSGKEVVLGLSVASKLWVKEIPSIPPKE